MRLVIGGANQGKLALVLAQTGLTEADVAATAEKAAVLPVLNHFHLMVREWMEHGKDPVEETEWILQKNDAVIILCDEIGCGIVPVEAFEREWREQAGRLCCMLAKRAKRVDRIFCGIASTIKIEEEE